MMVCPLTSFLSGCHSMHKPWPGQVNTYGTVVFLYHNKNKNEPLSEYITVLSHCTLACWIQYSEQPRLRSCEASLDEESSILSYIIVTALMIAFH